MNERRRATGAERQADWRKRNLFDGKIDAHARKKRRADNARNLAARRARRWEEP